jgi:hypothetical protein
VSTATDTKAEVSYIWTKVPVETKNKFKKICRANRKSMQATLAAFVRSVVERHFPDDAEGTHT